MTGRLAVGTFVVWCAIGLVGSLGPLGPLGPLGAPSPAYGVVNDLAILNDDFDDASTIGDWNRRYIDEGLAGDQLERYEIDPVDAPGQMLMMPWTTTWYQPYQGPIAYKDVTGDFVITTNVTATARSGSGAPSSSFSLAGLMIRTPNPTGAAAENYVFLSLGRGTAAGHSFEVKTTINGNSTLHLTAAGSDTAQIQIARLGDDVITLYRRPSDTDWVVHRRYDRGDMPQTLNVGMVTYTDWPKASTYAPAFQNTNVLNEDLNPDPSGNPGLAFNPDLIGRFDHMYYHRPDVPGGLDPATATDEALLAFLGDAALPVTGDTNLDGVVNEDDVNGLIAAISGATTHPQVLANSDIDGDGRATMLDINGFLGLLPAAPGAPTPALAPEPVGGAWLAVGLLLAGRRRSV